MSHENMALHLLRFFTRTAAGPDFTAVHAIHISADEIAILAGRTQRYVPALRPSAIWETASLLLTT